MKYLVVIHKQSVMNTIKDMQYPNKIYKGT